MPVDKHAASPVRFDAKQLAQRRSLNTRRPQRNHRIDALFADHHIARLHIAHMGIRA